MTTDTFTVLGVTLLDVPHARDLARECIEEDVYELASLEGKWRVLDLGACFGEFSLFAASLGHEVLGVEPSRYSWRVAGKNMERFMFDSKSLNVRIWNGKVSLLGTGEESDVHYYWDKHPAGSGPKREDSKEESVHNFCLTTLIWCFPKGPEKTFVKIDIEGDEVGLFKDVGWLKWVDAISMETHNHDADYFSDILEENGFEVERFGTCPQPLPAWDKSMTGGLVIARRP